MSEKRFILCQDDLGNYEIRYDDKVFHFLCEVAPILNEQQSTIGELQSIINHIKCEENCEDYDYCCETVNSLYDEIKHLKEENEQLKERLYDFEKRKIIEESAIDEDVIPKVKLLRTELFGEKYE